MKHLLKALTLTLSLFILQGINPNSIHAQEMAISESKIVWKGYKVTGSHEGTINIKDGSLMMKEGILSKGSFTIDMSTITCTDLEGEYKGKLEGHLKSDDFFGVAKYPTATLEITEFVKDGKNSYNVMANLTIKGITNKIKFPVSIYGNKATASLKIDRTAFDVKYGSGSFFEGLKDNMIYDEFDLVVDLSFTETRK